MGSSLLDLGGESKRKEENSFGLNFTTAIVNPSPLSSFKTQEKSLTETLLTTLCIS